jgi:hypothetical protein
VEVNASRILEDTGGMQIVKTCVHVDQTQFEKKNVPVFMVYLYTRNKFIKFEK